MKKILYLPLLFLYGYCTLSAKKNHTINQGISRSVKVIVLCDNTTSVFDKTIHYDFDKETNLDGLFETLKSYSKNKIVTNILITCQTKSDV